MAGTQNLIPIKKGSKRAKVLGSMGGKRKTPAKTLTSLTVQSKKAKCKNCSALCVLKKGYLEEDKNQLCTVPIARAQGIFFNKPVMSIDILERIGHRALLKLIQLARTPKEVKMLHDVAMKEKEYYAPPVKKVEVEQKTPIWELFQDSYAEYNRENSQNNK